MVVARERLIAYLPWFDTTVEKGYTFRMRESLAAFGRVVGCDGVVGTWRTHHRRVDWLVLNWTDNDLVDRRTGKVATRKIVRLFAKTLLLRLAARRLAFVRHNVYPHAVASGDEAIARRWVDRYERLFDVVLSHSGDDSQRQRAYCPHPLYRRLDVDFESPLQRELPSRYFVAFGRIVRYKRLERLMADFPDDQTLLVIGAVGDQVYADELARLARPNVLFRPGVIDEASAQALVVRSAALLIVHADRDVIVSSSFFFAMSLLVPVVAIGTPYLHWIAPRVGPGLLRTAKGLDELLGMLRGPIESSRDEAVVEREFGDDTLRRALSVALRPADE